MRANPTVRARSCPAASFRVTVDDFLAGGGDGFLTFTKGTNKVSGPIDLDALGQYLAAHSPLTPGPRDRIVRLH
jgi:5'-nucleotidase